MRTFSHGLASRSIAQILAVAFFWSTVLIGLGRTPAGAQIPTAGGMASTRAATTQSVAVVPFENQSGYRPETFGQEAADAVTTELRDRLNLDILPKADVDLRMRDLGYKPPFSDVELARLATELEVNMIVTGQVRSARVVQGKEGRYGEVVLAVLLFDRVAQVGTNGALVTVPGPASTDASDDTLITKALQQAAFDAVQQMRTRPTVTAMVLWARDSTVFLNVGGRAGVEAGMKMVAFRQNLRIGMVEVTEATPVGSYATIIQGPPLRTGDHLRAIYQLPVGVAPISPRKLERKQKSMYNLVLAAAAILGATGLGSGTRRLVEGNKAAPQFRASNLANSVQLGFAGFDGDEPATLITWVPYSSTEKTRIAGYEIVHNNSTTQVLSASEIAEKNYYIDLPGVNRQEVTISIDDQAAVAPIFAFSRGPSTADLGITSDAAQITWVFDSGAPPAGVLSVYQVKPVIAIQVRLADGTYQWEFARDAEFSSTDNILTAVPPVTQEIAVVSGNLATFTFYAQQGADDAVIQIARDPNSTFPPDRTFNKPVPGVIPNAVTTVGVNLVSELRNLPGSPSTILWWRIGVRNRADAVPPRPWPLDLHNDDGYIWNGPGQRLANVTTPASAAEIRRHRDLQRLGVIGKGKDVRRPGAARDRVLRPQ